MLSLLTVPSTELYRGVQTVQTLSVGWKVQERQSGAELCAGTSSDCPTCVGSQLSLSVECEDQHVITVRDSKHHISRPDIIARWEDI